VIDIEKLLAKDVIDIEKLLVLLVNEKLILKEKKLKQILKKKFVISVIEVEN